MRTIQYYTKNVYGKETIYLAAADDRRSWQNLTGRKTVTKSDMVYLSQLAGFTVEDTFERVFEPVGA